MPVNKLFLFVFILITTVTEANTLYAKEPAAEQKDICKLIKKEKMPVAYLLDEKGKISRGPINYGRYGYSYKAGRDFYYIPTKYRIVIYPTKLKVIPLHAGSWLELKEVAPVCRNSKTYEISYANQESPQDAYDRSWLPRKENVKVEAIEVEDPNSPYPVELKYRFDLRIIGEIYGATLK